jgi:hypothetical protein
MRKAPVSEEARRFFEEQIAELERREKEFRIAMKNKGVRENDPLPKEAMDRVASIAGPLMDEFTARGWMPRDYAQRRIRKREARGPWQRFVDHLFGWDWEPYSPDLRKALRRAPRR